jgi:segregation and condensation protein B
VNSTGVIRTLLERHMIRVSGRKNVVGSPFLYRTTREFLVHFGLNDIRDLPRLEEFGELIGENINDDLVAAINAAPQGDGAQIVEGTDLGEDEATTGEAAAAVIEGEVAAPLGDEGGLPVEAEIGGNHDEVAPESDDGGVESHADDQQRG